MTKSLNGNNGAGSSRNTGEAKRARGSAHGPRNPPRTNATKPVRRSSRHRLDPKLERSAWLEIEALITGSHRRIEQLFARAAKLQSKDSEALGQAFDRISDALRSHVELKTTQVYPPLYESLLDAGPILEAEVELELAQGLLDRVAAMQSHDEMYQPVINILGAWMQRHFEIEKSRLFPLARRALPSFSARISDVRARFDGEAAALAEAPAVPAAPATRTARSASHKSATTGARKSRTADSSQRGGAALRMKSAPDGRASRASRSHR